MGIMLCINKTIFADYLQKNRNCGNTTIYNKLYFILSYFVLHVVCVKSGPRDVGS